MAISASIKTLLKGEQVAGSKISSQLTDELMAEGLLSVVARGSRKIVSGARHRGFEEISHRQGRKLPCAGNRRLRLACLDGERYGQLQTSGRPIMSRISHKQL